MILGHFFQFGHFWRIHSCPASHLFIQILQKWREIFQKCEIYSQLYSTAFYSTHIHSSKITYVDDRYIFGQNNFYTFPILVLPPAYPPPPPNLHTTPLLLAIE
jgi:hypothetical protein